MDTHNTLPSGEMNRAPATYVPVVGPACAQGCGQQQHYAPSADQAWTWSAMILPYIEQGALFNELKVGNFNANNGHLAAWIDIGVAYPAGSRQALQQTRIATYLCPSSNDNGGINKVLDRHGMSHYVATATWAGRDAAACAGTLPCPGGC